MHSVGKNSTILLYYLYIYIYFILFYRKFVVFVFCFFFVCFFLIFFFIISNVKKFISSETKIYLSDFRTKLKHFSRIVLNLTFIFSILIMFLTNETEIVHIVHILVFTSHCSFHIADISLFKSYRQNPSKHKIHIDNG